MIKRILLIILFIGSLSASALAQLPPETKDKLSFEEVKEEVVELIKEMQSDNIKNSINENNCFTDNDYSKFQSNKIVEGIIEKLKKDEYFLGLVKDTALLNPRERRKVYRAAKGTYEKTWAEIGNISPAGQTDAGSKAEREIAYAVTKLLEDLVDASIMK